MTTRVKRVLLPVAAVVVLGLAVAAVRYGPTVGFLLNLAGIERLGPVPLPVPTTAFSVSDLTVPTRGGALVARLYRSSRADARTVVVFPGVHGGGVDEPRLALFCGRLASTGLTVLCTPLPELRQFRITSHSTDAIEDVVFWAASQQQLARDGRVGLVGVSFSGGLSLVAAGRPRLANKIDVVVSVGGYGDLPRALRYLCTGELPDGTRRAPHDYGLAVVALAAVPKIVPAAQVAALEHGVLTFLEASLDDSPEHTKANRLVAEARAEAAAMDEPAKGILTAVLDRDVVRMGALLLPLVDDLAGDPNLSPARSPVTTAPVFIIHGQDDNVIPSSETPLVAADLTRRGNADVRYLLTPLVSHANLSAGAKVGDLTRLVSFWREVLARLR